MGAKERQLFAGRPVLFNLVDITLNGFTIKDRPRRLRRRIVRVLRGVAGAQEPIS